MAITFADATGLQDSRTQVNTLQSLLAILHPINISRLAGHEDVNDAERAQAEVRSPRRTDTPA